MARILITGGTGLIGTALTRALRKEGHQVIILTRDPERRQASEGIKYAAWDVNKQTIDEEAIRQCDAIVHLAGANVAEGRWTGSRKKEIVDSRVLSGQLLVKALQQVPNQVKAVICSSAIGWYGPDPQVPNPRPFVETDPPATDFLGTTCKQWEGAITPVSGLGKRLVILRTGIVLSTEGGAYKEFKKPLNFGVASVLGPGTQVISWIHIDDLVNLYCKAIGDEEMKGIYNAVAPNPVSNKTLILQMAKIRDRPYVPAPVPTIALKLMLGEMSIEVLKSTTVGALKAESAGFRFTYPTIQAALEQLHGS